MEIQTLQVESRKPAGSRAAARLRRTGKLPAVLYGHERPPASLALDQLALEAQLGHGAHLINLQLEGKEQPCLIKDVQYDHLGSTPIHVDLTRVDLTERVTIHVRVELRGHPTGVTHGGGVLMQEMAEVEIECRVSDIPEHVRVDVDDLELDQVLHVKDLVLAEGMTAKSDPEAVVAMVRMPAAKAAIIAEVEGETAAGEPEVISKGKEEEGPEKGAE